MHAIGCNRDLICCGINWLFSFAFFCAKTASHFLLHCVGSGHIECVYMSCNVHKREFFRWMCLFYASWNEEFWHLLKLSAILVFVCLLVSVAILICASQTFATYAQIRFDWFILSYLTFAWTWSGHKFDSMLSPAMFSELTISNRKQFERQFDENQIKTNLLCDAFVVIRFRNKLIETNHTYTQSFQQTLE